MKNFLSLMIVVVSMLFTLGLAPSLTANDPAIGSTNQPIKVLHVKLGATDSQSKKVSWLEGLEVQIENISGKPIQYLVMHLELRVGTAAGDLARVPLTYGQVFADAKSGKVDVFQPGARLTLRASKIACERIEQLVASGFVPSLKETQPNLHVVMFADKTSWMAGRLHYQDQVNPKKWIAVEELVRNETSVSEPFVMSFLKASFKPSSKSQTCFRYVGFHWEECCGTPPQIIYAGHADFAEDPTGNVHPKTVQACCSQSNGGGCCNYEEIGLGCAP